MKYTLNYIWINSNNIHVNINECEYLNCIRKHHKYIYKNREIDIKYWNWNSILPLIKRYDYDLYILCTQINPAHSTLLADISRFIILYFNPGVYIDSDFILTEWFDNFIENIPDNIQFVSKGTHCGSKAMVSGLYTSVKHAEIIKLFLERVKTRLLAIKKRGQLYSVNLLNHIITTNLRELFTLGNVDREKNIYLEWPHEPHKQTPIKFEDKHTPYVRYCLKLPKYTRWTRVTKETPIFL